MSTLAADPQVAGLATEVPLAGLMVREFRVPPPSAAEHLPAVRGHLRDDPVRGWLVGIGDGRRWGWWGPLPGSVARFVAGLFEVAFPDLPTATPLGGFAQRLRRSTRHAHTGILAVAVGALELALWDLAAKRLAVPVWSLLAPAGTPRPVPAYATCFGVGLGDAALPERVAQVYPVQKWDAAITGASAAVTAHRTVAALGPDRLAIDFRGNWSSDRIRATCAAYLGDLAWVEEPYPADSTHTAVRGEFGAPHAAGEHCYAVGDTVLLERGGVDIWQPDAVFCGGMATFREFVSAAAAAGARCLPHGGGLLPALHAAAAGDPIEMVENHLFLEPRRLAHLARPPVVGDPTDSIAVPEQPGWCGELRKELVDD